jgi:hypothetical protein
MRYAEVVLSRLTVFLIKDSVLPPQPLSPAAHLQNPGLSPCRASASPMSSPSAVPDSSSVPPIPGDASRYKEFATHDDPHSVLKDLWKSASLSRLGSVFE